MASKGQFSTELISEVHSNISQEIIQTTVDKLRLALNEHLEKIERRNEWIAPFSLTVAIATVFATSNFKQFIFSAETWEAVFLILGISSGIWLLVSLRNAWCSPSIDDLINKIKTGMTVKNKI